MKNKWLQKAIACLGLLLSTTTFASPTDTLKIKQINNLPAMDGKANDIVWQQAEWVNINQVWIPWKTAVPANDFSGRYKVLWSQQTNLLYFVAEITDDVFRDGYVFNENNPSYSEYDIFEIFIDANRSGGLHVFDGTCDDASKSACWGVNGENAFTYHINVNAPADGAVTYAKSAEDLSGKDWDNMHIRNYANHLPEFAFRKNGNVYTYEFSLKVFKDSFNPDMPSDADRDQLFAGKIIGLSAAYCDDDHATGEAKRDSFIGSTPGDGKALDGNGNFNQTWMNSSYFGIAQLVGIMK